MGKSFDSNGPSPLAIEAIKKEIKNINLYPEVQAVS
jgi:hypothetical protein